MQIHGITATGDNAPPLLRIAVQSGDLVAVLKTDSGGKRNDAVTLAKQLGPRFVKVDVTVRSQQLIISVDGQVKLTRNLAYWKHLNYFKAGCYPQATQGAADVFFRKLQAE